MSDQEKELPPPFANLIAANLATNIHLDILEELITRMAEQLPEKDFDGLSPALWIEEKKIQNMELIVPHFPKEIAECLERYIKDKDAIKKMINFRREHPSE